MGETNDTGMLAERVLARDPAAWRELVRIAEPELRIAVREVAAPHDDFEDDDIDEIVAEFWLSLLENDLQPIRTLSGGKLVEWLKVLIGQSARTRLLQRRRQPKMQPLPRSLADTRPRADELLAARDVAVRLKVSTKQALRLMRNQMTPCSLGARTLRVSSDELERFIRRRSLQTLPTSRPRARLRPVKTINPRRDSERSVRPTQPRTKRMSDHV
jgi:hypothetical protein